jgi:hypothetical protein
MKIYKYYHSKERDKRLPLKFLPPTKRCPDLIIMDKKKKPWKISTFLDDLLSTPTPLLDCPVSS